MAVLRGRVVRLEGDGRPHVEVPELGGAGFTFGPCESAVAGLQRGERVIVATIGAQENVVVVASLSPAYSDEDVDAAIAAALEDYSTAAEVVAALEGYYTKVAADARFRQIGAVTDAELPNRLKAYPVTVSDFNAATESGFYNVPTGASNAPRSDYWHLQVVGYNANYVLQRAASMVTANDAWVRSRINGVWSAWRPVVTDLVSAAGQTPMQQNWAVLRAMDDGVMEVGLLTPDHVPFAVEKIAPYGTLRRATNVAMYDETVSNGGGELVIQTNLAITGTGAASHMTRLQIRGYNYSAAFASINLDVSFYAYAAGPSFEQVSVVDNGTFQFQTVRFMRRASDGKVAIVLTPAAGIVWNYPKVTVDAWVGHTAPTDAALQQWVMYRQFGGLTGLTAMTTATPNTRELYGLPLSRTNGYSGRIQSVPNDGALYTTSHWSAGVAVPARARTVLVSMQQEAHCIANCAVHWWPTARFTRPGGAFSDYALGADLIKHNEGQAALNLGYAVTAELDVRAEAARGDNLQLYSNMSNDPGSGAWVHPSYMAYSVTFKY